MMVKPLDWSFSLSPLWNLASFPSLPLVENMKAFLPVSVGILSAVSRRFLSGFP